MIMHTYLNSQNARACSPSRWIANLVLAQTYNGCWWILDHFVMLGTVVCLACMLQSTGSSAWLSPHALTLSELLRSSLILIYLFPDGLVHIPAILHEKTRQVLSDVKGDTDDTTCQARCAPEFLRADQSLSSRAWCMWWWHVIKQVNHATCLWEVKRTWLGTISILLPAIQRWCRCTHSVQCNCNAAQQRSRLLEYNQAQC